MSRPYLRRTGLFALTVLLGAAGAAHADAVYQVAVNTGSIAGTNGSIDFQFNAGSGATQAAAVTLSNFTGGTLGSPMNIGAVSGGPLPAGTTLGNGVLTNTGDNEVFETFKYGTSLSFTLTFGGPAVVAPNGLSTGNSEFFFSLFSDAAGTVPVLTSDPNGVAATVIVNPNGSTSRAAVSPNVNFVPEPGSVALVGSALALLLGVRRRLTNRVG